MAGTFVADRGSGSQDSVFSLTWTVVTVGAIAAGGKAILAIRSASFNTVQSVSGGGVTWTIDGRAANTGANGGSVTVISADCPAGLANGTTLTIVDVAGGDIFDKRRWGLSEFAGLALGPPLANEEVGSFGTSALCNAGNISGSSVTGDIGFAAVSFPANSVAADHTPTNSGTKIHTVSSASGSMWDNYRILGSISTPNGGESTSLGAANWAAVFLVYSAAVVVTPGYSGMHSPAIPHVVTEIAFASQPADVNPVWTTVSPYVKEIHSKYGRSNPLEDIDAGSCSYIFDNRDRRFEPLYTAGPYYPNIRPLKRIRSYSLENPLTHPDFEDPTTLTYWTRYQGDGVLSRPAYGTAPAPKFNDNKIAVDIGTGPSGTWSGITQAGCVFQAMPATNEYVGISVYCYAAKAGFISLVLMNQAGATIASTTYTLTANQWNRITTYGQVPAGTTSFTFIAQPVAGGAAWAAHDNVYFDGAGIHHFHTTNLNFVPQTPAAFDQVAPFTKTIYVFDGFIEGWPQEWAGGMQAECTVTAVDGFKPLTPMQVNRGLYNLVVMDDIPTWYFRLGEQVTTQAAQNAAAAGIQDGVYTSGGGSPILGLPDTAIIGESDTAAKFTTTGGTGGTSDMRKTVVKIPTRQFALEMLQKFDNTVPGASPDNNGDQYTMWSHGDNTGGYGSIIVLGWNYFTAGGGVPYTGMHLYIEFYYGNNWNINRYYIPNPAGTAAYWTSWHLISLYWDGLGQDGNAGWPQVWLDGTRVDISSGANLTYSQNCNVRAGNSAKISRPYLGKLTQAGISRTMYLGNDYTSLFGVRGCTIDEFAYWVDAIPPAGFAARHFAALSYGAPVEDSGARMSHLLDQASLPVTGLNPWPAARRQIDTGVSQVIGWRWNEEKLVDLIKQCTKSEGGTFYFHPNGKATFYNRWHTIAYPYSSPKGVLSDQPIPANQLAPFEDVGSGGVDFDDQDIYNDVTISRFSAGYGDASGAQSVFDQTSQADYLVRSLTLDDTIVTTDAEALNAANWYLYMFKNPGLKAKSIQVEPLDDPTNIWRLLGSAFISDRLSVTRHPPPGSGSALTFEVLIQGVQYDIDSGGWHVDYTVYPGPTRDFWQLPDSATNDEYAQYSVLGVTTRLAY